MIKSKKFSLLMSVAMVAGLMGSSAALAQAPAPQTAPAPTAAQDAAARFGELESVRDISLSPDGSKIAFISPGVGLSRVLYVVGTEEGAQPRIILRTTDEAQKIASCQWATNQRLICQITRQSSVNGESFFSNAMVAMDSDGRNPVNLSNRSGDNALYIDGRGGDIVDWLPNAPGSILMMRSYVPEAAINTRIASSSEGMGVDQVNVVDGTSRRVERARPDAVDYISDGNGVVRIMATIATDADTGRAATRIVYLYKPVEGGNWRTLASYDRLTSEGIYIVAVDSATNSAIGFKKIDGRDAVVSMLLDGSGTTTTIFAHPVVDVDGIIRIGRSRRIAGITYVTERREAVMTDPALARMSRSLSRALGGRSVYVIDTSGDESRHLVWAGSDTDPGQYYLYTPAARELRPLMLERPALDGVALSAVQPVTYPAADGTMIPGYLTLPPGRSDARGLPAIVMPHGGPSARDEWGFDWLSQYFAAQGYAVLQPNFRGSSGYGDAWYQRNGFQSWRTSIGDVADGGRWLVAQGVDPAKLSIVGWSYGGYAALQSGVLAPGLFRSIVAIAPVTDLQLLKEDASRSVSARLETAFIGSGAHIREGSPARNVAAISVPILMFHGTEDQNVPIEQARFMRRELQEAGKPVELIEYPGLAHSLTTSEARTDMLRRISAFLPH